MRTTVISVTGQPPDLLLALRPGEIDNLINALQNAKRDPSRSLFISAVDREGKPLVNVELYLDETDRGAALVVANAPACLLPDALRGAAA